jgi:hypothetical protein
LVEGSNIRSVERMIGVAKHTIPKLLEDMGCASAAHHHRHVCGVVVRRLQCHEVWGSSAQKKQAGWGDAAESTPDEVKAIL